MPGRPVDPARLEGEELRSWYLRTPEEIEAERRAAAERHYTDFFGTETASQGGASVAPRGRVGRSSRWANGDPSSVVSEGDQLIHWTQEGRNRWRKAKPSEPANLPSFAQNSVLGSPVPRALVPKPAWQVPGRPSTGHLGIATDQTWRGAPSVTRTVAAQASYGAPLSNNATTQGVAQRSSAPGARQNRPVPPPRPDPRRTEVFKRGPDGKLHPIAGWRTTGPFEFDTWSHNIDWDGVARDLGDIATGSLDFMTGGVGAGSLVRHLGFEIGPAVVRGIVHKHHTLPKFMGGPNAQKLADLYESLHTTFHRNLAKALKEAQFPPVGGRRGSKDRWGEYFESNPGRREEAIEILKRVTKEFDRKNGTSLSRRLDEVLEKSKPPNPPS